MTTALVALTCPALAEGTLNIYTFGLNTPPYVWGTTGIMVNTDVYKGDFNTSAIFLDPRKS